MVRSITYRDKEIIVQHCWTCPKGEPLIVRCGESMEDAVKRLKNGLRCQMPEVKGDVSYVCFLYPVGEEGRYEAAIHPKKIRSVINWGWMEREFEER